MQSNDHPKVIKHGTGTTVSISPHHLSRYESARQLSEEVCSLVKECAGDEEFGEDTDQLILDLASVDRISSAGLNGLIQMNSKSRSQGVRLVLVNVSSSVREVFELTRLERMFEFAPGDSSSPAVG